MKPFRLRRSVDACVLPKVRRGRRLRIGEWIFDPETCELVHGARHVALEPKLAATLLHLARHAGQVVARDELRLELSPTAMPCDGALTQIVLKLRRVLGETAKRPTYIETVAGLGYRLIVPVFLVPQPRFAARSALLAQLVQRSADYVLFTLTFTAIITVVLTASWQIQRSKDDVDALAREVASVRAIETLPLVAIGAFETVGGTPEDEQLARGLRTLLIADLSRLSALRVLSGDDAPPFAARERERTAGAFLINGSLRRASGRVAVWVRLTAAESGRVLFGETYDQPDADLLELQEEMASSLKRALAKELNVGFSGGASPPTRSVEAYEHYVKAQALMQDRRLFERARERYWRAVQLDPSFARAYAGLALTFAGQTPQPWVRDGQLDRALELARIAAEIDATIPEIHWMLAWAHGQRRNHVDALKHLRTALALNPSFVDGYGLLGSILIDMGRAAHAIDVLKTALQLNPNAGFLYSLLLGRSYFNLGDHAHAVAHLRVAVERNPSHLESHVYLAAALALAGQPDAAGWAIEEMRTVSPSFALGPWLAAHAELESKQVEKLAGALRRLGL